jgi:peptidoglycan/xylan/chitin deacetylase (PgdA/CDA1 family)
MRAALIKRARLFVFCCLLFCLTGAQLTTANLGEAQGQPTGARAFSDVTADNPNFGIINYLAQRGLITGYPDGTYHPWEPVTRAQAAYITVRALGLGAPAVVENSFYDVPTDHWAYSAVMTVAKAGYLAGYPDGTFRPDQYISRAEAAALAVSLSTAPVSPTSPPELKDVPAEHWAASQIQAALAAGSLTLRASSRFEPEDPLNRGELARVILVAFAPAELANLAPAKPAKVAYLTFDDGPSLDVTPRILEIVAEHRIPVTFFVLGRQVASHPEIVQQALNAGHAIGNHSYTHRYNEIYRTEDSLMWEINRCGDVLVEAIGFRPSIFRAPGGSNPFLKKQYIRRLIEEGYQYYDWNVCPGDAEGSYKSAQSLIANTLKQAKGKDRIIVLLHDAPGKRSTAEALPAIIEGLKEMGFAFAAITPDTEPIQFRRG